ncbi:MAG: hypothetical protein R3B95_04625 [Nitrospirales bacterium]|nr:hypothetical protein [Nitrospirales bacterium]
MNCPAPAYGEKTSLAHDVIEGTNPAASFKTQSEQVYDVAAVAKPRR